MAGLSSVAADALRKAISQDKKLGLTHKVEGLKGDLRHLEVVEGSREAEAKRILAPRFLADGTEDFPKGSLFSNLTRGLDADGIRSAVNVVESRLNEVRRLESEWIEKERIAFQKKTPHLIFKPDYTRF